MWGRRTGGEERARADGAGADETPRPGTTRRRRPVGLRWFGLGTLLAVVGCVVVFAHLWSGTAFDEGRLAYDGAWSGETTVVATYLGDMNDVCDEPRRGGGGPDVPVVAGLCDLQMQGDGLHKTEFAYEINLRGVTSRDDWIPMLDALRVASILIGASALLGLSWSGARGRFLGPGTAWLFWVLTACAAVGGVLTPFFVHRLEQAVIEDFVPSGSARALIEPISSGPGVASVVAVVAAMVFAEVWRRAASATPRALG